MSERLQLGPAEQKELLEGLTALCRKELPEDWQQLIMDYRQVGDHVDVATGLRQPDGGFLVWEPSENVWRFFQVLRHGMYTEGCGTWFSMRFVLDRPHEFRVTYNYGVLPHWRRSPPPPEAFALDLRRYPRTPDSIPAWFPR